VVSQRWGGGKGSINVPFMLGNAFMRSFERYRITHILTEYLHEKCIYKVYNMVYTALLRIYFNYILFIYTSINTTVVRLFFWKLLYNMLLDSCGNFIFLYIKNDNFPSCDK